MHDSVNPEKYESHLSILINKDSSNTVLVEALKENKIWALPHHKRRLNRERDRCEAQKRRSQF